MQSIRAVSLVLVLVGTLNSKVLAQQAPAQNLPAAPAASSASASGESSGNTAVPSQADKHRHQNDDDRPDELKPGDDPDNHLLFPFVKHLASDQKAFWIAPAHFQKEDMEWIVPFAGVTAGFIAGDSWISKQIPLGEVQRSKTISNYATYSLIGAGTGSFLFGHMRGDDRMSEAGLLSGEAAINSTAVAYLLKSATQRPRPFQNNGDGTFFQSGSSFPSEHSAIAWSIASVLAHEYPGRFTKILAYGLATGVSATRVTGQQHFASDVIVGSALGWYFGRQVYRAHHETDLGGAAWGDLLPDDPGEKTRNSENMGSSYVPLDSWIYPALERLVALGSIKTAYLGIRPWTRMECARMLEEAEEGVGDEDEQTGEAPRIYRELSKEFSDETARLNGAANVGASLDSIYARATNISGPPLRDGYHFGQTIINDYGRPYGEGFNSVDGLTARGEAGPFAFYIRGEYQHAPAVASQSGAVLQAAANADGTPPLADGEAEVNRFDVLEGSVALTFRDTQFSLGKQSLWLGPAGSGSFLLSDNSEPIMMFRVDKVSPYRVPLFSRLIGPVRAEFFIGQLSGHHWEYCVAPGCVQANAAYPNVVGPNISPQPFIHGDKISFKPTSNLEIGMGITAMFGGPGLPVTWHNFLRTYYAHSSNALNNPGKRISAVDVTYRVPGLRNWLTVYADSLVVDEVSPIGSSRASVNPGIYLPQVPKIPKVQVRAEGLHESLTTEFGPGFIYTDGRRFRDGYTNDGSLMGSWIGRAGRGGQGWLTYQWSPRTGCQFGYRLQEVSSSFIGGGKLVDYSGSGEIRLTSRLGASGTLQYEQWRFPVLSTSHQSNLVASVQLTFWPKFKIAPK